MKLFKKIKYNEYRMTCPFCMTTWMSKPIDIEGTKGQIVKYTCENGHTFHVVECWVDLDESKIEGYIKAWINLMIRD